MKTLLFALFLLPVAAGATTYEYSLSNGIAFTTPEILPPANYYIPVPDYLPGDSHCPGLAWVGCAGGGLRFGPDWVEYSTPVTFDLVDFNTGGGPDTFFFAPDALQSLGTYTALHSGFPGTFTISIAPDGTPVSYMPEPASVWLVAAGIGAFLLRRVRTRRHTGSDAGLYPNF